MPEHTEPHDMHTALNTPTPVPILMYHSISSQASPRLRKYTVSPQQFAEHMAYLAENHYTSLSVTQFVRALAGANPRLPERPVILTFDDGFVDFCTDALPVLKRYDFTATLYIATGAVGAQYWLDYEDEPAKPMLDWSQIAVVDMAGIECGAHSHSHPPLDLLPGAAARAEITRCKRILEERLDHEVSTFAYPFGHYTPAIRQWVRAAGYLSACSVKNAISSTADDPFALARLLISTDASVQDIARMITNRSLWVTDLRKEARIIGRQLLRYGMVQVMRVFPRMAPD